MSDPKELYKQAVIEHSKHPRNQGPLPEATSEATTINPLCGDKVTVRAVLDGDRITKLRFEGRGCAIAMASASMMSEKLEGQTVAEGLAAAKALRDMVEADGPVPEDADDPIARLAGVRQFPARKRCATLAWETLQKAIEANA